MCADKSTTPAVLTWKQTPGGGVPAFLQHQLLASPMKSNCGTNAFPKHKFYLQAGLSPSPSLLHPWDSQISVPLSSKALVSQQHWATEGMTSPRDRNLRQDQDPTTSSPLGFSPSCLVQSSRKPLSSGSAGWGMRCQEMPSSPL